MKIVNLSANLPFSWSANGTRGKLHDDSRQSESAKKPLKHLNYSWNAQQVVLGARCDMFYRKEYLVIYFRWKAERKGRKK